MQTYLFVGAPTVGTTFLVKYCGKLMSDAGYKIGIIDATEKKGLYYDTCIGKTNEDTQGLYDIQKGKNTAVAYGEKIDIFTAMPSTYPEKRIEIDYLKILEEVKKEDYDIILIDGDIVSGKTFIGHIDKFFAIQDFRSQSAHFMQQYFLIPLLSQVREGLLQEIPAVIVYNKEMSYKLKIPQLEKYLVQDQKGQKNLKLLLHAEEVIVPFEESNFKQDLDNIESGSMEVKKLSKVLKRTLLELCDHMADMQKLQKRKLKISSFL